MTQTLGGADQIEVIHLSHFVIDIADRLAGRIDRETFQPNISP